VSWVRFPLSATTSVVDSPAPEAAAAVAMLGYSRRPVLAAHVAAWAAVRCGALALLPLGRARSPAGVDPGALLALCELWNGEIGDGRVVAVHAQRQRERPGFVALLARPGRSPVLVKCRDRPEDLDAEERMLRRLGRSTSPFVAPEALAAGRAGGWSWLAMTAMPSRPHRPLSLRSAATVTSVLDGVGRALASLPRPAGVPAHWQPAHNDLAPWNLRRVAGRTWLLDWEAAGFAPPQADLLYLRATWGALGYRLPRAAGPIPAETVAWWAERLRRRPTSDVDAALNAELLRRVGA
jgi:hypothetical protein